MMCFGWRPIQSCYQGGPGSTTTNCPTPIWFYLALAAAVIGGTRKR